MYAPSICCARFQQYCVECHTMHNSQGGSGMVYGTYGTSTQQSSLLNNNCTGCHAGTNNGSNYIPYVLQTTAPTYGSTGTQGNTLAGGNFYWVTQGSGDPKGHNIAGLVNIDLTQSTNPPGGPVTANQITCAGTNGCHGDPTIADQVVSIHGSHHSDSTVAIDGLSVKNSYRWLKGVTGYEDTLYEYQPAADRHNQYKGKVRSADDNTDSTTMSSLCAKCHGDFHNDNGGAAATKGIIDATSTWQSTGGTQWIRHPVDYDMQPLSGEYDSFNKGVGVNTYSVVVPLASSTVASVKTTVSGAGDAIIMCLSCHRAHGSPYDSIMRWDYKGWPGAGYNGCAICHTSKD